jgi:hypothetical protein
LLAQQTNENESKSGSIGKQRADRLFLVLPAATARGTLHGRLLLSTHTQQSNICIGKASTYCVRARLAQLVHNLYVLITMRRKEGSLCSAFLFLLFTQYVESFFVQNDRASPVAGSVSSTVTIPSARTSLLPVEDEGSGTFDDDTLETRPNGNSTAAVIDDEDSLVQYEKDVTKVLRELRPWKYDPSVPGWFRTRKLSFTNYWGLSEWELHTSRNRYIRYIIDFPKSRLLRRLYPQMTVLLVWCLVTNSLARRLGLHRFLGAETTALSLVSTFVAAIQTLRSNQGLGRLADARLAMGRMVLYTRDLGAYA